MENAPIAAGDEIEGFAFLGWDEKREYWLFGREGLRVAFYVWPERPFDREELASALREEWEFMQRCRPTPAPRSSASR